MTIPPTKWISVFRNLAKQENTELREEVAKYQGMFKEMSASFKEGEANALEEEARTMVKEKYNLDWNKDVLPEVKKLMARLDKTLPKGISFVDAGWNAMTLTRQVLAEKDVELAKKVVKKETTELNKKKKNAQVETDTTADAGGGASDDTKSLEEIWAEEEKKAGLSRFE